MCIADKGWIPSPVFTEGLSIIVARTIRFYELGLGLRSE